MLDLGRCRTTANERFLVVNIKPGNLVGSDGALNASEGLVVISSLFVGMYLNERMNFPQENVNLFPSRV